MSDFQPCSHLDTNMAIPPGDALQFLLEQQYDLITTYYMPRPEDLTIDQKLYWTQDLIMALYSEISELQDQTPWKWWKKKYEFNEKELKFEIIDILKFLLTIMLVWEMDKDEILKFYMAKFQENVRRQENGY